MIDLKNIEDVKGIKANLRSTLETDAGKEVIKYLDELCGWYDFSETDPNLILINTGKRQVLATIKTLIRLTADQIVAKAQMEE